MTALYEFEWFIFWFFEDERFVLLDEIFAHDFDSLFFGLFWSELADERLGLESCFGLSATDGWGVFEFML